MDDVFGHWLAGFFDGEGYFGILPDNAGAAARARGLPPGVRCIAGIQLRADDEPILHEIAAQAGVGHVTRAPSYRARTEPQSTWSVAAKAECGRLVEIFDRYPLRSKKVRHYAIWREAVLLKLTPPKRHQPARGAIGPARGRVVRDWEPLLALAAELKAARAYMPPA